MALRSRALILAVASLIVAGASQACPDHASTTSAALTPPANAAALVAWKPRAWTPAVPTLLTAQGLRVSIDPVDGGMGMPSPDDLPAGDIFVDADAPTETLRRENGSVRATLDARHELFTVVRLGADGKPSWTCVRGPQGAAQFLKSAAATAPVPVPAPGTAWEDK